MREIIIQKKDIFYINESFFLIKKIRVETTLVLENDVVLCWSPAFLENFPPKTPEVFQDLKSSSNPKNELNF